jgi:uncharacterized protein involved in exopolysaccharide biosynthesis
VSAYRDPDSFEFADYAGVLRRRWWVILVAVCAGLLAAGAYLVATPKAYTATAAVNVTATADAAGQGGAVVGSRTNGAINLDTEAQIVRSGQVASIAARALHSPLTAGALARHVSDTVPANSSVLQIACQAASPGQAAACANAFAAAYLQNRNAVAAAGAKAQLSKLSGQLGALQKQIAELTFRISVLPANSTRRASDQAQLQTASSQLRALAGQSAALTAQGAAQSGGSVISKATPPGNPSSPKKLLVLPSGLLAGLIIGLIAAFTWDRRDPRLKDAREAQRFGVPALVELSARDLAGDPLVPHRSTAGLKFTELARYASGSLGIGHQLLVVGTAAGSGASVVSANLAAALARVGSTVILVCPAESSTPKRFGLAGAGQPSAHSAANLASGAVSVTEAAAQPRETPGLRVIVLRADLSDLPHDQAQLLATVLHDNADYIVCEVPQLSVGAGSLAIAEFSDAAVVALEVSRSRRQDVEDCIRRLGRLDIQVLGTAVVPRAGRVRDQLPGRDPAVVPQSRRVPALARGREAKLHARWRREPATPEVHPEADTASDPAGDTASLPVQVSADAADRLSGS